MNIKDIEDFRLSDAVEFHNELNPLLFTDEKLQKDVRDQLMIIAHEFVDFMGIQVPKVVDVRLYGSNAAYTYTKHSDIDLHVLVDMTGISDDEVYMELFNSKKKLFNETMNITVRGLPVELYMQSSTDEVKSLGDYSVLHDDWVKLPKRVEATLDDHATREKFKRLVVLSELALRGQDLKKLEELISIIRRYRKAGLEEGGEFSPENAAYKALRSRGILDKLYDHKDRLKGQSLSIDEQLDESSGYIPTERQKNDPRFKTALSVDVRPGATGKNANRMALKTGPNGEPTLLIKKLKNALREFKETGQMPEKNVDLFEINMSPTSLQRLVKDIDALAGIEFEMYVPDVDIDGDYDESEPDYDYDEGVISIEDARNFFARDRNGRGALRDLYQSMYEEFEEWRMEQISDSWANEGLDFLRDYVANNDLFDRDEHLEDAKEYVRGKFDDLDGIDEESPAFVEAVNTRLDELEEEFVESEWENSGSIWDDAREEFEVEHDEDYSERDWLESAGLSSMMDIADRYDMEWPYLTESDGSDEIENIAHHFKQAIGRPVIASGGYHRADRQPNTYIVEPDGSLSSPDNSGDGGLEFVSPPLPLDELLSDMEKVRKWAKSRGCYTNDSTGLHMNVSVPGTSTAKLDYVKLALLLGDRYILEQFGRLSNRYAQSAMGIIEKRLKSNPSAAANVMDQLSERLGALATKEIHSGNTDKYTSINTKDGYIEFRSPGGDWLDANWSKVIPTLLRTVVALDAAMDPEKYRQEYQKKLYKLLQSTAESENNDIIKLFSMYASGIIDKSQLVTQVRQQQLSRDASKGNAGKMWWRVGLKSNPNYGIEVVGSTRSEAIAAAVEAVTELRWYNQATDFTAKPIRAYSEPGQPSAPIPPQQTPNQRRAATEFTGQWKIVDGEGREIHRFGGVGNAQSDANRVALNWLRQNPRYMQDGMEVVPIMS